MSRMRIEPTNCLCLLSDGNCLRFLCSPVDTPHCFLLIIYIGVLPSSYSREQLQLPIPMIPCTSSPWRSTGRHLLGTPTYAKALNTVLPSVRINSKLIQITQPVLLSRGKSSRAKIKDASHALSRALHDKINIHKATRFWCLVRHNTTAPGPATNPNKNSSQPNRPSITTR